MEKELFDYADVIEASLECLAFGECVMKKDFGPLKAGSNYASISFYYELGICQAYLHPEDDQSIHEFQIGLVALP